MARRIFRFDPYRIDLAARELRRAGELVALSPRIFDCIAWLIEHRERAVGRDELAAAIWGKADVADTQLIQTVLKARRALGDTGDEQRAIRTIPRFGYRWVAAVEVVEAEEAGDEPTLAPPEPAPPAPRASSRRWTLAVVALLALVCVVAGIALQLRRSDAPASASADAAERTAIVVLPATIGAEREWSWLRLGVMDLVAGRLHEAGLAVVPSDNVVSLVRDRSEPEGAEQAVREAVQPRWMIVPGVQRQASSWTVSLDLRGADGRRVVEAVDADPVVAARLAAGRLLSLLGKADPSGATSGDDLASRIRAALLGGDFVAAERQIEAASPAQRAAPEIRLLQAQTDFGLGRFETANERFTALLQTLGEQADATLRARALKGRAASEVRLSRLYDAERDYDAALALLGAAADPGLEGQIYSGRGVARALLGEDDGALGDFARARIALQLAGDALAIAGVEMNEGALNGHRGRPAEALASFRSAERHFARFDSRVELAAALANQIEAHLALLEPARALEVAERGRALAARLANPAARRLLAYWRAKALAASGRLAEAGEELDPLIHAPDAAADAGVLAMSHGLRAALALGAGEAESAAASARQALAIAQDGPWKDVRGEAWLSLVRALRGTGADAEAAVEVGRFAAWAQQAGDPAVEVLARLAEAEQAAVERRADAAAQLYAQALSLAERSTVPAEIARVAVSWGSILLATGEPDAAGPVIGRVARWASSDYACALLQAKLYRALGQRVAWQAALAQARALAGERAIPAAASVEPGGETLAAEP